MVADGLRRKVEGASGFVRTRVLVVTAFVLTLALATFRNEA
jgi:hypothetical protein